MATKRKDDGVGWKKKMQLVEKHDFLRGSEEFKKLDALCFLSKNLYNSVLFKTRQLFFAGCGILTFPTMCHELAMNRDVDYQALPAKVAQHVVKLVYEGWYSFFALSKMEKEGSYDKRPRPPKYLRKTSGRQVLNYTKQAVSLKNGLVSLSRSGVSIKTRVADVQFVRVVPKADRITVEVGYQRELPVVDENRERRFASVDVGQDNLATVTFCDAKPYIVNGRPVKSVNHEFNRRNAILTSLRENGNPANKKWTHQQVGISRRRSNRISDYFHKASRFLIDDLAARGVTDLVVGHNDGWKQGSNMGQKNNQTFVSIPFNDFINDLVYKGALAGIEVHVVEESYTSKASFLDRDFIPTYRASGKEDEPKYKFSGYRETRGTYKSKVSKRKINADVNGSLNIMRKFFQNRGEQEPTFSDECCLSPKVLSFGAARNHKSQRYEKRWARWDEIREIRRKRFQKRLAKEKVVPKYFFLACV